MNSSKIFFDIIIWLSHFLYVFFCGWGTKYILNNQNYQKTSKKLVLKQCLLATAFYLVMLLGLIFRIDDSDRTEDGEPLDIFSYRTFIIKISIIGFISSITSIYVFNAKIRLKNSKYISH